MQTRALFVVTLLIGSWLPMPFAYAQSASTTAPDVLRRASQYASVQQAVYQLVADAKDVDNDGTLEVPAMKLGTGQGPLDGGVVPDTSGAPKTDGFGGVLGYCAWDNGFAVGPGRLPGGLAASSISVAVIAYGLDNVFQTSCADVAAGSSRGDDYVFWMTSNQMATASSSATSTYWGPPVLDQGVLLTLAPAALHDGEIRLTRDNNHLYRWDALLQQWTALSAGGSQSWVDLNQYDAYLANGKAAIGQATIGAEKLVINGGATATALGVKGVGATTGVNFYNTAGSAVNAFLGYDNTNNKMLIDLPTGAFNIKIGGIDRFTVGVDGAVVVNGYTVLDANRNLAANSGAFSGNLSITGALLVGGTTVLDAARNLSVNSITATGSANVGALSIGGSVVIDSDRNATFGTLLTAGQATLNTAVVTNNLTVGGATLVTGLLTANGGVAGAVGPLTASALNINHTWNNGGATYNGLLINVTNTSAMSTSKLLNLQVGGVTKFAVDSAGNLQVGNVTAGAVNGVTLTANTLGFSVAGGTSASKTLTVSNALTLAGTDGTTMTFPSTSAAIARVDAAQSFSGLQTFTGGVSVSGGNVTVANNLSAGTLTPTAIVSEGSSCAGYASGAIATSSTTPGASVSCQGGAWTKSAGAVVPGGLYGFFNAATCPAGWVAANGANGTVDLRGEFVRGWDNGRGADSGRGLASWQAATRVIANYWGDGGWAGAVPDIMANAASSFDAWERAWDGTGPGYPNGPQAGPPGAHVDGVRVRPRNIALLACMKQ